MRRWVWYVPLLSISLVFFVVAALQDNYTVGFAWAIAGALVPAAGAGLLIVINIRRWRRMADKLGLVQTRPGTYPDLGGRFDGRKLTIMRRVDPYASGVRDSTVLRLEGHPEIRLPGTICDPDVIRTVLTPLLE